MSSTMDEVEQVVPAINVSGYGGGELHDCTRTYKRDCWEKPGMTVGEWLDRGDSDG